MDYKEFVNEIIKNVKERLGEYYDVSYNELTKNNSCLYTGIIISSKKKYGNNFTSPAIYLEEYYKMYNSGMALNVITDRIIAVYRECCRYGMKISKNDITKDKLPDRIFYRLVNYELNQDMLKYSPYIPFMDLAVTFHYLCSGNDKNIQSFRITDRLMNEWKLDIDDMYTMADNNMKRLFPEKIIDLKTIMLRFLGLSDYMNISGPEMYALTNKYCLNGAATMLYTTSIQEMAEINNTDVFILPSSIHEIIIIPAEREVNGDNLRKMVIDINREHVAKEEWLSNNVYRYSHETGQIEIFE